MTPDLLLARVRVSCNKSARPRENGTGRNATKGCHGPPHPQSYPFYRRTDAMSVEGRWGKTYETYDEYLASAEWFARRHAVLEHAGHSCQLCNRDGHLHVHHRTYERVGHERLIDLTVLCDECHAWFHVPRSDRLLEEGKRNAKRVDATGEMDSRRVAMHLARGMRMDRAGG